MINKKFYIDYLSQQTKADCRPYETALSDFCDYLLDLFSVKAFDGTLDGYKNWQQKRLQAKPKFGVLAVAWLNDVSQAMDRGQWLDVFGMLYEDMYLTAGKASKTGQFFTPQSVSNLMSSIIGSGKNEATSAKIEGTTVNDCAAGSGRLLLAHFIEATKLDHSAGRTFQYVAQDSDPLVCKMCALNMMVHGMNGRVICQDTLSMSTPSVEYFINEVRYPFSTPYYSVRIKSGNPAK